MKKSELIRVIREELKAAIKEDGSPAAAAAKRKEVETKIKTLGDAMVAAKKEYDLKVATIKIQLADAQKELATIQTGG